MERSDGSRFLSATTISAVLIKSPGGRCMLSSPSRLRSSRIMQPFPSQIISFARSVLHGNQVWLVSAGDKSNAIHRCFDGLARRINPGMKQGFIFSLRFTEDGCSEPLEDSFVRDLGQLADSVHAFPHTS